MYNVRKDRKAEVWGGGERSRIPVGFLGEFRRVRKFDRDATWVGKIIAMNGQRSVYDTAMWFSNNKRMYRALMLCC